MQVVDGGCHVHPPRLVDDEEGRQVVVEDVLVPVDLKGPREPLGVAVHANVGDLSVGQVVVVVVVSGTGTLTSLFAAAAAVPDGAERDQLERKGTRNVQV